MNICKKTVANDRGFGICGMAFRWKWQMRLHQWVMHP